MSPALNDDVMETLLRMHVLKFESVRDTMAYYNLFDGGHADKKVSDYQYLHPKAFRVATPYPDQTRESGESLKSGWWCTGSQRLSQRRRQK
jgi:hypothetical protein